MDLTVDRRTGEVVGKAIFSPRDVCASVVPSTTRCDPAVAAGRVLVTATYEGAPVVPDASLAAILAPAVERVRNLKSAELGVVLDTPLRRAGGVESPLGNLFSDALRESVPNADIAANNTVGGLRADLSSGPLTYGSLYEVFPFDNKVVRLSLTGVELRRVVAAQLRRNRGTMTSPVFGCRRNAPRVASRCR